MLLSIIIPTYNGKKLLEKCLPLLFNAIDEIKPIEIIIVDNGSSDETNVFIKKNYPSCIFLSFKKNRGFTGAVNEGIKNSSGKYILILNNDCFLNKKTVNNIIYFLENNEKCFATQPIILDAFGNIENIGFIIDRKFGKANPVKNKDFFSKNIDDFYRWDNVSRYVYGISGACFFARKKLFDTIGLFDETFESYLEDVDISIRMIRSDIYFCPFLENEVVHQHMSTSKKMGFYKEKHDFLNWIRIILKHYSFIFFMKNFFYLILERFRNANGLIKKIFKICFNS